MQEKIIEQIRRELNLPLSCPNELIIKNCKGTFFWHKIAVNIAINELKIYIKDVLKIS